MKSSVSSAYHIDFDQWVQLAASNPQEFEVLRRKIIHACIKRANSSRQQRLHGLQWRIDRMRENNQQSPMAACVAISNMMWETFTRLGDILQNPDSLTQQRADASHNATVISFPNQPQT